MKRKDTLPFDAALAESAVTAFSGATGIHCQLCTDRRENSYACCQAAAKESFGLSPEEGPGCSVLHRYGAAQAERFGGRYIYMCPMGMVFFSSPIMLGGAAAGTLLGGPVRVMDTEEQLADLPTELSRDLSELRSFYDAIPFREPEHLRYLSDQLFASAVMISDSSHELFLAYRDAGQQSAIGESVYRIKQQDAARPVYPFGKEEALSQAVARKDTAAAMKLLNELLGYIFFYAGSDMEVDFGIAELIVVLTRAVISGGAEPEETLRLSRAFLREQHKIRGPEALARWLSACLHRLMDQTEALPDARNTRSIRAVLAYMRSHCTDALTLKKAAKYAGYTPTYFSRLFREEVGTTFKDYLIGLRIERSKYLLLTGRHTVAEVSVLSGFNDESYFCKTFRNLTGVTPSRFRSRERRILSEKEYGGT